MMDGLIFMFSWMNKKNKIQEHHLTALNEQVNEIYKIGRLYTIRKMTFLGLYPYLEDSNGNIIHEYPNDTLNKKILILDSFPVGFPVIFKIKFLYEGKSYVVPHNIFYEYIEIVK